MSECVWFEDPERSLENKHAWDCSSLPGSVLGPASHEKVVGTCKICADVVVFASALLI